jgi:hypothetical protein
MAMIKTCVVAAWCALWAASAGAHELPTNRLSLVLRDAHHVTLTYFIDYVGALHQSMAPQKGLREFVLQGAAMAPADFQGVLARAHATLSAQTRLTLPTGGALVISKWQWPAPARAQALLQKRAMQMLVPADAGGVAHAHDTVDEVQAQATSAQRISSLQLQLPPALGKVLTVSYRPRQAWATPNAKPLVIGF